MTDGQTDGQTSCRGIVRGYAEHGAVLIDWLIECSSGILRRDSSAPRRQHLATFVRLSGLSVTYELAT